MSLLAAQLAPHDYHDLIELILVADCKYLTAIFLKFM